MKHTQMGAEGTQRLTEEQRYEITQHGVEIINNQQNNMLSQLFNALDEDILTDRAKRYFIVIDRLAVCRREHVFSEESALGGRFEVKIRATDAILPSHSTINEVGKLLSDRLLEALLLSKSNRSFHAALRRRISPQKRYLSVSRSTPAAASRRATLTRALCLSKMFS